MSQQACELRPAFRHIIRVADSTFLTSLFSCGMIRRDLTLLVSD